MIRRVADLSRDGDRDVIPDSPSSRSNRRRANCLSRRGDPSGSDGFESIQFAGRFANSESSLFLVQRRNFARTISRSKLYDRRTEYKDGGRFRERNLERNRRDSPKIAVSRNNRWRGGRTHVARTRVRGYVHP